MHGLGSSALKKGKMQTWAYTPLFQQQHVPIVEAVLLILLVMQETDRMDPRRRCR
jgi:hypothetical protein